MVEEKNLLCVVLRRSPEGAAPFKVSQTSRGAGRTTASFNTSQRLERGAAVLRIHAAQQKTPLMHQRDINSLSGVQRVLLAQAAVCSWFFFKGLK